MYYRNLRYINSSFGCLTNDEIHTYNNTVDCNCRLYAYCKCEAPATGRAFFFFFFFVINSGSKTRVEPLTLRFSQRT